MELALRWPTREPFQIHAISERQGIPMRYLVQILIQLKRVGLVSSVRGKAGGYNLGRPPREITLGEVMRCASGPLMPIADSGIKNGSVLSKIWDEAGGAMAGVLDNISFENIADRARGVEDAICYQI